MPIMDQSPSDLLIDLISGETTEDQTTGVKEILDVLAILPEDDIEDLDMDGVDVKEHEDTTITHKYPLNVIFYKAPYNRIRRSKIMLFGSSLEPYEKFRSMSSSERAILLKKLERSCYNYTIDIAHNNNVVSSWEDSNFCNIYHSTCYKLSVNLEPTGLVSNPTLAKNLLNNQLNIPTLPRMSSVDMFPQKYTKILQRIDASKNASQTVKTSTMYKCGRCYENRCTIENVQNRSLDETTGLRITCINCGNEFGA